MPYANPFLVTHHSSRYSVVGVNSRPLPNALSTPCVSTSCHTEVQKDEARNPAKVRTTPRGPTYRRRCGHRVRRKKVKGDMRYITPWGG